MKNWQRYSEYKDSGVECLGEIPRHWEVKKLKYVLRLSYGDSLLSDIREDGDIPVYGSNGIIGTHKSSNTLGPCIILGRKGSCGKITYSENSVFAIDTTYFIDRTTTLLDITLRWLFYALSLLELDKSSQDTGVPGLNREFTHNQLLALPASIEQKSIAHFLDRETSKLDNLIAKKERFIELLQEKRTALISHAVTKGLNPDVPMKDSGIEWLGQIPRHWEVVAVRRLIGGIEQGWSPTANDRIADTDKWGVIKLSAVNKGVFKSQEHKALPETLEPNTRYEIKNNDILLTRANTPDMVGDICVVSNPRPHLMLCDLVYRIKENDRLIERKYFSYWFLSKVGRYQITKDARGSSLSMVKVSQTHIKSWLIALPSIQEQQIIANYLKAETSKIDTLIEKTKTSIEKLKEYRTALISAAVTGKIDIRGR